MYSFEVENIKCGGCANTIKTRLAEISEINNIQIKIEEGIVNIETENENEQLKQSILAELVSMGYPEKGSVEGLGSVKAKASSFVSCAIGKMSQDKNSDN